MSFHRALDVEMEIISLTDQKGLASVHSELDQIKYTYGCTAGGAML